MLLKNKSDEKLCFFKNSQCSMVHRSVYSGFSVKTLALPFIFIVTPGGKLPSVATVNSCEFLYERGIMIIPISYHYYIN